MDKKNGRKCLACGKIHYGEECPIIIEKINKYMNSSKKNYLVGNILLECIRKKVDFYQILSEIAEQSEHMKELHIENLITIDIIEYFAISLNCKSSVFFKNAEKTSEEYCKLLESGYVTPSGIDYDENNKIERIGFHCEIDEYQKAKPIHFYDSYPFGEYSFTIARESIGQDEYMYELSLSIPKTILAKYFVPQKTKKGYIFNKDFRLYLWGSMFEVSTISFLLLVEKHGALEKFFENTLNYYWADDEFVLERSYDDKLFNIWMEKLEKATANRFLQWTKHSRFSNESYYYTTTYDQTDIEIHTNLNTKYGNSELLYIRCGDGGTGYRFGNKNPFYSRVENGKESAFDDATNKEQIQRMRKLIEDIEKSIINWKEKSNDINLPGKLLDYSDVIVTTKSLVCHKLEHTIVSLRGIVKLLDKNNCLINYEVYVGYCSKCNKYYMFERDFIEMKKIGKPLCSIYYNKDQDMQVIHTPFRYMSQSVLNAMGYTVEMNKGLSSDERQKILAEALQKNLFDIHDLLSFLNWLIKTRETQEKYREAVRKWNEDLKFVENYEKETRKFVKVNSIIVN